MASRVFREVHREEGTSSSGKAHAETRYVVITGVQGGLHSHIHHTACLVRQNGATNGMNEQLVITFTGRDLQFLICLVSPVVPSTWIPCTDQT